MALASRLRAYGPKPASTISYCGPPYQNGQSDLLEHHAFGPLPHRHAAEDVLGLGVDVVHVPFDAAEDRLRAQHIDRHLGLLGRGDGILEPLLVVADLVGHDDDHRAIGLVRARPCSGPSDGRSRRRW